MNKIILYIICSLIIISSVFAVSRSTATGTITYTKQNIPTTILKGYWAIEDTVSECTFSSVSCGTSSYYACSKPSGINAIRVVAHSDDSGANLPPSVVVTVGGTGTCTLSMNHVESWKTSTATNLGSSTGPVAGSVTLGSISCNTVADKDCDNSLEPTEIGPAITAYYGSTAVFPAGTITPSNIGKIIQSYYGASNPSTVCFCS